MNPMSCLEQKGIQKNCQIRSSFDDSNNDNGDETLIFNTSKTVQQDQEQLFDDSTFETNTVTSFGLPPSSANTRHNNRKHFEQCSSSDSVPTVVRSEYQTKLRPTLKCIRNTLGLDYSSKSRYDRLPSKSKSNLYLPSDKSFLVAQDDPDTIDQSKVHSNNLDFKFSETKSSPMKLNKAKINSVSTTSLCSDKESSNFNDSNPATMLLPNTTTFRSFIKTKSTGIIIRKDSDEDDEEVEKLCDSECSKISNDCSNTANTSDPNQCSLEFSNLKENLVTPSNNVSSDEYKCYLNRYSSIESTSHFLTSDLSSNTDTSSISSSSFISANNNNNQKNNHHHHHHQKRHHRPNPILPILKPNRFVKHSKGHLLFNQKPQKGHNIMKKRSNSESLSTSTNIITSHNDIIESLCSDRMVMTQPDEDRRRRTIIIEKQNNSFGFTLQTYGIKHGQEIELITYVDEVTYGGPAFRGGMRPGDVILSINGRDVEKADHPTLVHYINSCEKTMRLVVLFEDCVRKIELHLQFIKLQKTLHQKLTQLEILNRREDQILLNAALRNCVVPPQSDNNNGNDKSDDNNIDDNDNQINQQIDLKQKKKYKCKSLDVSLCDLNDCERKYDDDLNGQGHQHDHHYQSQGHHHHHHGSKEYSTTFPRQQSLHHVSSSQYTKINNDNNEENEIFLNNHPHHHHYHRQTDNQGKLQTASSGPNVGGGGSGSDDDDNNNERLNQLNFRCSKSLPQSVANSLDCLTNEAYEDDEDLIIQQQQENNSNNNNKMAASNHHHSHNNNNKFSTKLHSSDKEFITKL